MSAKTETGATGATGSRIGGSAEARDRGVEELISLLHRETRLIAELRELLIQQRAAVGAEDAPGVQASIDGVGRILTMLAEARSQRARKIERLGVSPAPATIAQLETSLGVDLPMPLVHARAALAREARSVVTEVSINRTVLRRAVETGEAFLQALFSCLTDPSPVYQASGSRDAAAAAGPGAPGQAVLLNRVV